jgi:hypothetical protein
VRSLVCVQVRGINWRRTVSPHPLVGRLHPQVARSDARPRQGRPSSGASVPERTDHVSTSFPQIFEAGQAYVALCVHYLSLVTPWPDLPRTALVPHRWSASRSPASILQRCARTAGNAVRC